MRKHLKPKSLFFPEPVCIIGTYDSKGNPNAMNAAWGGISDTNEFHMCISNTHKTVKNFLKTKCFTVSCGTAKKVVACDYVGMVSGNDDKNKLKKCKLTPAKSSVNAPYFKELPFALECKLISYDSKTGHTFAKIVGISADSSAFTNGKLDIKKINPIIFNGEENLYHVIGKKVGHAFKDYKKIK